MITKFIEVDKDDIIINIYEGDRLSMSHKKPEQRFINVPFGSDIKKGDSLKCYDMFFNRLTELELIEKGLIAPKEDEKIEDGKIIKLSEIELIKKGLKKLDDRLKIEDDKIIEKTLSELVVEKIVTVEDANIMQEEKRYSRYKNYSDPLFFKYQRGQATKQEWENAVKEIKEQYPDF